MTIKKENYTGQERRKFVRIPHNAPLQLKICAKNTLSKLLDGYTINISEAGLLLNVSDKVKKNDIIWLSLDRGILAICENLEKNVFIYQNGIIAKVVRVERKNDNSYDAGLGFITREEKNLSYIYPKIHFLKTGEAAGEDEEEPKEEDEIDEEKEPGEEESQEDEQEQQKKEDDEF